MKGCLAREKDALGATPVGLRTALAFERASRRLRLHFLNRTTALQALNRAMDVAIPMPSQP